jgi:hypothetical protein
MFKIQIKNLANVLTNEAQFDTMQNLNAWYDSVAPSGAFGKLEREVKEVSPGVLDNNEDISKSVSSRQEEFMGEMVTIHTLPQEFTSTITDITSEHQARLESNEARAYLHSTDWMVVRKAETGIDYSQEIKDLRAAARLKVI